MATVVAFGGLTGGLVSVTTLTCRHFHSPIMQCMQYGDRHVHSVLRTKEMLQPPIMGLGAFAAERASADGVQVSGPHTAWLLFSPCMLQPVCRQLPIYCCRTPVHPIYAPRHPTAPLYSQSLQQLSALTAAVTHVLYSSSHQALQLVAFSKQRESAAECTV